ncbi:uncharacterized [Tachysurus ichikawai]
MNVGDTYANDTLLSTHLFGEVKRELKLHSASFFLTNVGEKKTSDADQGVEAKGQELLQQGLRGTWQYFSETSAMNKLPPFLMYTRYHDDHLDSPVTGQQDGGTRIQRAAAQKLSDQRLRRKFCSNGEDSQDDD